MNNIGKAVALFAGLFLLIAANPLLAWWLVQAIGLHPTLWQCYAVEFLVIVVAINVSTAIYLLRPQPEPPVPNRHGSRPS